MRSASNPRILQILTALPVIWICLNVAVWGVNLPFWDQWAFVPLLADFEDGKMQWIDLIAQHNEHRPIFPRLVWIGLAQLTNYNVNAELWVNLFLAMITATVFGFFTRRTWQKAGVPESVQWLYLPIFALLIFNMVQWESWLMGFQTVMFLGIGCVVIGFLLLTNSPGWTWLLGASLLGIIATYTMANALLFWPIGLALIALNHREHRLWKCLVWSGIGAVASILFLINWSSPSASLSTVSTIHPVVYLHWLLNFLGSPLLAYPPALLFGAVSVCLLLFFTVNLWQHPVLSSLSPYYAIMLFIIGSAIAIGIGRSYGGPRLALAPRYVTQTSWYWAALLVLFPMVKISQIWRGVILVPIVAMLLASTAGGAISAYKWRYLPVQPAYQALRAGESPSDEALIALYEGVDPDLTRGRLQIACDHAWSACPTER